MINIWWLRISWKIFKYVKRNFFKDKLNVDFHFKGSRKHTTEINQTWRPRLSHSGPGRGAQRVPQQSIQKLSTIWPASRESTTAYAEERERWVRGRSSYNVTERKHGSGIWRSASWKLDSVGGTSACSSPDCQVKPSFDGARAWESTAAATRNHSNRCHVRLLHWEIFLVDAQISLKMPETF